MSARSLLDAFLALLFPDRCAGCARMGTLFCLNCHAALAPYPGTLRRMPAGLADMRIAYIFQSPLREAVHQLKYRRVRRVARPLGALMRTRGEPLLIDADLAVPVPLHPFRRRERGFNQAEDLAQHVGLPMVVALRRVRRTAAQADLPAARRHGNVKGAFAARHGRSISGKIVVLIDDVSTTGATLDACAIALKEAGAREVRALTAARVVTQRR